MTAHDDDILDFDFVDDETRELAPPATVPARGSRRPATARAAAAALAARSSAARMGSRRCCGSPASSCSRSSSSSCSPSGCRAAPARTSRRRTAPISTDVDAVGKDSAKIGADLATLLTTPGLAQAELETSSAGSCSSRSSTSRAHATSTRRGRSRRRMRTRCESLELRVPGCRACSTSSRDEGLRGRRRCRSAARGDGPASRGERRRLEGPLPGVATEAMTAEGVQGLTAPASVFVENTDLYTARSMSSIWQRVHGASTGGTPGGLHGSQLAFTEVQPAGVQLRPRPRRRSRSPPTWRSRSASTTRARTRRSASRSS